jgi:hypothetical protein
MRFGLTFRFRLIAIVTADFALPTKPLLDDLGSESMTWGRARVLILLKNPLFAKIRDEQNH